MGNLKHSLALPAWGAGHFGLERGARVESEGPRESEGRLESEGKLQADLIAVLIGLFALAVPQEELGADAVYAGENWRFVAI